MQARIIRIFLYAGAAIFAGLLALNLYIGLKPAPQRQINEPLAKLLPAAPSGWTAQDVDIAETPEMRAQVESVLHFDDAAYRVYRRGDVDIGLYVAYWQPGKFSPAKVGSHTPDTCWVHNGWTATGRQQAVVQTLGDETLKPLETGCYEKDGQTLDVVFWHLVGGQPVRYELSGWQNGLAGRLERFPIMMQDLMHFGVDQRQEQLVVRISSTQPFKELWDDPGFEQLMLQIGRRFGLLAPTAAAVDKKAALLPTPRADSLR